MQPQVLNIFAEYLIVLFAADFPIRSIEEKFFDKKLSSLFRKNRNNCRFQLVIYDIWCYIYHIVNEIEIDANIKSIVVSVWDYAAEDGDRVRVQHFINGKLVFQTGEITIMHAPKVVKINGITYAANIGGRSLTNRTQTASANRYKIKRRTNGQSGPRGYAQ